MSSPSPSSVVRRLRSAASRPTTGNPVPEDFESLLRKAREGDAEALGRLLKLFANYLKLLTTTYAGANLRYRIDTTGIVQKTLFSAYLEFQKFAGSSEKELMLWLRRILADQITEGARQALAGSPDLPSRQAFEAMLDRTNAAMSQALPPENSSIPLKRRERAVLLAEILARMGEAEKEAIILRNLLHLSLDEVAVRMGLPPRKALILWARALERLNHLLEREG